MVRQGFFTNDRKVGVVVSKSGRSFKIFARFLIILPPPLQDILHPPLLSALMLGPTKEYQLHVHKKMTDSLNQLIDCANDFVS